MSQFTSYTTRQGQRWDTIAYEVYDDPYLYSPIIEANPQYIGVAQFLEPVVLRIPVVESIDLTTTTNDSLPPWRR